MRSAMCIGIDMAANIELEGVAVPKGSCRSKPNRGAQV